MKGDVRALYHNHVTSPAEAARDAAELKVATMFDRIGDVRLWPDGFPQGGFASELVAAVLSGGGRIVPADH